MSGNPVQTTRPEQAVRALLSSTLVVATVALVTLLYVTRDNPPDTPSYDIQGTVTIAGSMTAQFDNGIHRCAAADGSVGHGSTLAVLDHAGNVLATDTLESTGVSSNQLCVFDIELVDLPASTMYTFVLGEFRPWSMSQSELTRNKWNVWLRYKL